MARCDAHDEIGIPEMANDAPAEKSGSAKHRYEHAIPLNRPALLAAGCGTRLDARRFACTPVLVSLRDRSFPRHRHSPVERRRRSLHSCIPASLA